MGTHIMNADSLSISLTTGPKEEVGHSQEKPMLDVDEHVNSHHILDCQC